MQCKWLGERVAAPNLRTVVRNAITQTVAPSWGPNATFRFPSRGGTGGIWAAVANLVPTEQLQLGSGNTVESVHLDEKVAVISGKTISYDRLISTMPVDQLLDISAGAQEKVAGMKESARGLVYSSTIVLGVGVRGERPERIGDKCESSFPLRSTTHQSMLQSSHIHQNVST